jgi:mevalonate kinase
LSDLLVFQTGRPKETTGEVVAAVRGRQGENPSEFERRLDTMRSCVVALRDYLCGSTEATHEIVSLMRRYERCLEQIGVVPESVREVVRAVETLDGGAKISGAGTLSGDAAGCLLVHGPANEPGRIPRDLEVYRRQHVELGGEGFRVEEIV